MSQLGKELNQGLSRGERSEVKSENKRCSNAYSYWKGDRSCCLPSEHDGPCVFLPIEAIEAQVDFDSSAKQPASADMLLDLERKPL